jgi:acyl-CoA synthetase (AMP-forming)/AMP-acid ligase II
VSEAKNAVQKAVAQDHEIRVHDVVFIQMRTMAKTASGKHQRNLCKAEYLSNQLSLFKPG